jgi:hypothetical protein
LCNPADIDGEGVIGDPIAHLMCYNLRERPGVERRELTLEDRYAKQTYTVAGSDTVCVPATIATCQGGTDEGATCVEDSDCDSGLCARAVCVGGANDGAPCNDAGECDSGSCSLPEELSINQFKCYGVRRTQNVPAFAKRIIQVADTFEENSRATVLKKPKLFCTPVSIDGDDIIDPAERGAGNLTCYTVKDVRGQPRFVPVGFETLDRFAQGDPLRAVRGDGRQVSFVCVPSFLPSPSGAFLDVSAGVLD